MSFSRISNQQTSQATSSTLPISSTHTSRATSPTLQNFEELPLISRPPTPTFATRSYTSSLQNQPEPLYVHKVLVAVADKGCQTPDSKSHTIIDSLEPVPTILENHSQSLEFLYSRLTEINNTLISKDRQVKSKVVFEDQARRQTEAEAGKNKAQVVQILRNSENIKIKNEQLNCMQISTIVIAVIILLYKIIEEVIENFT